jgi:hypothetical protein
LQLQPRNLRYDEAGNLDGHSLFKSDAVNFPLDPDPQFLERLNRLKRSDGWLLRFLKLLAVTGSNRHLLTLIVRGIRTGLSHGTVDVIYRLNTGSKSRRVLDNIDIAVGALQRRVIVADILAKQIQKLGAQKITSVAGGSCLLAIEGVYQSGRSGVMLINLDRSQGAHAKARRVLAQAPEDIGLRLRPVLTDVLTPAWGIEGGDGRPRIVECTGFWEYLTDSERAWLLKKLSAEMNSQDVLILTFLRHNPQQDLFEAMNFKQLRPHPLETMLPQIKQHFEVGRVILTGNETYVTMELKVRKAY